MKSFFKTSAISLVLLAGIVFRANSQSIKILGADLVNGAITGVALGGATMALQNSKDQSPLRVGLGLGILYGIGTGIYDNSKVSKGEQLYISGTFNDGKNSTVLVLLDTFYGAAGGAAIGGAISLIGNEPLIDGLQYGSGAGTWLGFGFGLIDAFALAKGPGELRASAEALPASHARGIIQYTPPVEGMSVGFIHPSLIYQKVSKGRTIRTRSTLEVEIMNVNVAF